MDVCMCVSTYVCMHACTHAYCPGRRPRPNHFHGADLAICNHPSRSYMQLTYWPLATPALANRIPPFALFTTAYMPIQSIYNTLVPVEYLCSSHILATIKILHAILLCIRNVLLSNDISITPDPPHRGGTGVS